MSSQRTKYNWCQNVKRHIQCVQLNTLNGDNEMDLVLDPWDPMAFLTWSSFLLTRVSKEASLERVSLTTLVCRPQASSSKDQCLLTCTGLTQSWYGELYFSTISSQKNNFLVKTYTRKKRITKKSLPKTQRVGNLITPSSFLSWLSNHEHRLPSLTEILTCWRPNSMFPYFQSTF